MCRYQHEGKIVMISNNSCGRIVSTRGVIAAVLLSVLIICAAPALAAVPGAPIIGVTSGGNKQVAVNFTAPASNGGSAIIDYTITSNPGNLTATGSESPITINGLTNGTVYTFTVTARNDDGTSPASGASNNTTPRLYAPTSGTIDNLVVFIRFSDQPEFTLPLSYYDNLFNLAGNSLKNFYLENSYNTLTVNSTFYPSSSGSVISFQDSHPTSYYQPYNASTNPLGYQGAEGTARETALVTNALNAISAQIPAGLNLDGDNDGYIDHITFEVYSTALNPQPVMFYSRATYDTSGGIAVNGKNAGSYTWVAASQDAPGMYPGSTEIHEMGHSFGYPDLRANSGRTPVGNYDVMSLAVPVHSGAYLKYRFTKWISNIPEITSYGTYSINDITQSTNNSYRINLPNNEFLILEYRKAAGPFESNLPGSGLCITKVNESAGMWGNLGGPPFYLYYYRTDGTASSDGIGANFQCLNAESGRTQFNDYSNPACFLSDGSACGISIYDIGTTAGSSITFSVGDPNSTVVTHIISGYLADNIGNRVNGATVTLSGDAAGSVTTVTLGKYLFTVNSGGSYTITPAKANLTFSPINMTFNNVTSDQTQNFPATNNTNTISGTITSAGTPLSGVTVNCSVGNCPSPVTTDATGTYSFIVNAGGNYDVSPAKTNYFFSPYKKSFTNVTTDQVQDFTTWTANVNLTGTITYNGSPLSGVSVSCPGANSATSVTTDGSGAYSFNVTVGNGSTYTVTPSSSLYTFSPINRFYTGLISSQVQNFTAPLLSCDLNVTKAGNGSGTVTADTGLLSWTGNAGTGTYSDGTQVTLTPKAGAGSAFSGWSGACTGNSTCKVTMTDNKSVTAAFNKAWSSNPKVNNAISTAVRDQINPQITGDGSGGAIIIWQDYRSGTNWNIYAQRIDSTGNVLWTANGVLISGAVNDQSNPQIVADGSGGAIITWQDYRSGTNWNIYAQRIDATGHVLWTANGVSITIAANDQSNPQIVSDGSGGAIITWQDYRSGTNWNIYAQRIDATGTTKWTANGKAVTIAGNDQINPQLVSDVNGGAIITWQDSRNGTNWDIYAQRIDSTGTAKWTANGKAVTIAGNDQINPQLVSDVNGGAIITWQDSRNGTNWDIYAQRIDSTGTAQWTANGKAVTIAGNDQVNPHLVSDGSGGAIITWNDKRSGTNLNIYAQNIDSTGNAKWLTNGVTITGAVNDQSNTQIVSDDSGGAIIVWEDYRSGTNMDIYARRIDAHGTVMWVTGGTTISTAAHDQINPRMVSDGFGGAIITWDDYHSGTNHDIYIQKVESDGKFPTAP